MLDKTLSTIYLLQPHFFNSFYRRVRVVRELPKPLPPAVTIDVTHVCALRCPFCIASDVLENRHMPLECFRSVIDGLQGVGRITLIGGEPFQHPELEELVRLSRSAAREVEIFTNGLILGKDPEAASLRIRARLPEASTDWLTLVMSADPDHGNQMPPGRLDAGIRGLLELDRGGVARARFSITHKSLTTGTYLDLDTVCCALGEVSGTLEEWFRQRIQEGTAMERFYFNSVIGGRLEAQGQGPELLRLEDLVLAPEVAVSFDQGGEPLVYSSLASMWSRNPPPATVLGHFTDDQVGKGLVARAMGLDEADSRLDSWLELVAKGTLEPPPGAGHPAWTRAWGLAEQASDYDAKARLLRGLGPFVQLMSWDQGTSAAGLRAERILAFLRKGTGERALRWGGDEGGGPLDLLTLILLLEGIARAGGAPDLAEELGLWVAGLFSEGEQGWAHPVWCGHRELLGMRVPLPPGVTEPLDRLHLPFEAGFGPGDELVVRPVLVLEPDGAVLLRFPGVEARVTREPLPVARLVAALQRLMDMLALLVGPDSGRGILELARAEGLPEDLTSGVEIRPGELLLPGMDDLQAAFEELAFDRNRQCSDQDNPELLALVLRYGEERFSKAALRRFRSRALTWLEGSARRQGLSTTARTLLQELGWRGRDAARLKACLDARPGVRR